jgi:hypothetical protein
MRVWRCARAGADLEGDREVAEALGEDPDNGVGEPDDDGDASELAVDSAALAAARLGGLGPRLAEGEDDVEEPAHSEEPPHPLDVADSEGAESTTGDHEDCRYSPSN